MAGGVFRRVALLPRLRIPKGRLPSKKFAVQYAPAHQFPSIYTHFLQCSSKGVRSRKDRLGLPNRYSRKNDHLARNTLNRPERLNALNEQLFLQLNSALDYVAGDRVVRTLVLIGASTPSNCTVPVGSAADAFKDN